MNVKLLSDRCMTCGLCAATAPTIFSIDSGTVTLKKDAGTFTDEEKKLAKEAAIGCPAGAIEIIE
jgi:ferredoxin